MLFVTTLSESETRSIRSFGDGYVSSGDLSVYLKLQSILRVEYAKVKYDVTHEFRAMGAYILRGYKLII